MGPKQRKSSRRLSISQTFHTLKRSSSIIKDLPQQIINHLNTKKILTKKVWIESGGSGNSSSESSGWKLYRVIKQENNNLYLQEEGDGSDDTNDDLNIVDRDNVIMINLAYLDVYSFNDDQHQVPDMINLKYLNEPTIIYNIKQRYLNKLPYTYMGSILITANPFEWSQTFSPIDFIGKSFDPNKPHPYAIAESTFQQICCLTDPLNQSVIISGESGAGKTETSKMILSYLVGRVTGNFGENRQDNSSDRLETVESRLLLSSPILESFGNAQTSRNNNSSRFGKYVKILFAPLASALPQEAATLSLTSRARSIIGATIETYLLEKSRVTGQSTGEKNFHIFYLLLHALESNESSLIHLKLSSLLPKDFAILGKGTGTGSYSSELQFSKVLKAMKEFGLCDEKLEAIWRLLGAILELGNLEFHDVDAPTGLAARISEGTEQHAQLAADLLRLSVDDLLAVLLTREMKTGRETFTIPLKSRESFHGRNAFLKTMYSNLFAEIVSSVNQHLSNNSESSGRGPNDKNVINSISVLDIFGFESFEKNDFEQLLINYANEALQCAFNEQIFQNDLQLFQNEQIEVNLTLEDCPSNHHCVRLISSPSPAPSILSILQSVAQLPTGSDESFCENLHSTFGKIKDPNVKKAFLTVHPKDRQQLFAIKHYAGRVVYTVGTKDSNPTHHWINKNHDYIPEGLLKILLSSELQFIQLMSGMGPDSTQQLAAAMTTAATTGGGPRGAVASHSTSKKNLLSDKKVTVADRFVSSMNDLFISLRSSSCSFIKCIKPNRELKPFTFDDNHVIEQVRSLGLVQVCEVMKVGLPIRIPFQEILSRYQDLYRELFPAAAPAPSAAPAHAGPGPGATTGSTEEVIFISSLLYALKIPIESYKLGKSMLFFIPNSFELVDLVLSPAVVDSTSLEEEIRSGILEGLRIRKLSGELIESLKKRLVRLDDWIGELKLQIDGFDGTIGTVTSDLEGLHDQVQLTKVQMESMAVDLLPREQALLQEIQRDMAMVMKTMKEREEELSSEEWKSDSCNLQKVFHTMTQRNEMNESLWNAIANQFHFVNQSSFSEQSEEMRARSSKLLAISSEIDEMMPHVRYLIDKTLKRAERTPILKVQSWCEDCEHNITLLTSQLDRMAELLKEGQEMVRELMKSIEKIQEVVSEIKKMSQEMQRGDEEIKKMSQEIKAQMAELKEKITRYERELEEKLRAEKEAEEIENVRLEWERQRLLEEKKRQEEEEEKKKAEVEAAKQERQQFAAASVSVAEETPEEEDDGYNFDEEDEEDDLPLGWEKVVVSSHSDEVMYRSLLTDECQSEYPSGPARTKQAYEETEEDDEEQESEESLSQEEEKGSLDMGGDAIASPQRGRRRISFISVTTSDGIVGYEPTPPPAPLVPAVAQEKDEVDREREKEKDEKQIFQVSVTKRSLVKKLFSIVHEEKYKTEYGGLETVVSVHKKGILFKQGKFFGIWKRMFVVLDGNLLTQYKNSQGYYTDSTPYKAMELTGSSVLSYTKFSNCFTIFSKTNSWVLMTENETEFLEWMNALKTVITALFHERIENVYRSSSNDLMKEKKGKKRGDGSLTKTDTAEGWN